MKNTKKAKTINAFQALKKLVQCPNRHDLEKKLVACSSNLEDLMEEAGDRIVSLRMKGMTIKAIAKKIHKRDRYVSAVLEIYYKALDLPKVMTPAARKYLRKVVRTQKKLQAKKPTPSTKKSK